MYTGPSWGNCSFDAPEVEKFSPPTSLAKEWNIPCKDLTMSGYSVLYLIERKIKPANSRLPIVWVYSEPILDLTTITGMSFEEFIASPDWFDIRQQCNQHCLEQINSLGNPVLLIGGHSDIENCDTTNLTNITIAAPSWQKWIAESAGMTVQDGTVYVKMSDGGSFNLEHCWGAEVAHKFIHEHQNIDPDPTLLDAVWDIYYFWQELENRGWFYEVHPNKKSNIKFAKFLKPVVDNFLSTI